MKILVVCAGGHAKVIIDSLKKNNHEIVGIVDDNSDIVGKRVHGCSVLGTTKDIEKLTKLYNITHGIAAITNNKLRQELSQKIISSGLRVCGVIDPTANISNTVEIHETAQICPGVIINPGAKISEGVIVNTGAIIEHNVSIGEYTHITPSVSCLGYSKVGKFCLIGANSCIRNTKKIGDNVNVGMGAAVVGDLPSNVTALGVPAKIIKSEQKESTGVNKPIPLAKPWISEEEPQAAANVVKSGWLIAGPNVKKFEEEFAKLMKAKHAIAVNSGSAALLVSLAALGVKPGDEIIVPDMTFVSTATSAMYLGAKPVFADIDPVHYCINSKDIEKRITEKTKGIIPVHYAGHSADMDEIKEIAKKHNLFVLEDAAEAHTSEYKGKPVGTIGDIGIFSFTPSKPMTTGEGGMIITNNDELAKKCKLVKDFYDISKFDWQQLGFNFRMPDMMGAIGLIQLKKLPEIIEKRRHIAALYNKLLDSSVVIKPYARTPKDINYQVYTIRVSKTAKLSRDELMQKLSEAGISSRLYYPTLHQQGVFKDITNGSDADFPNAVEYRQTAVSLPIFTTLSDEEIHYIANTINKLLRCENGKGISNRR